MADAVKKVVGEANVLDLCWLDTDCHRGNGACRDSASPFFRNPGFS